MPPPQNAHDGMTFDYNGAATQEETQQTQLAEVGSQHPLEANLWGYLIPCSPQQRRLDFSRDKRVQKIGRNRDERAANDHVLLGMKISECSTHPCFHVASRSLFVFVRERFRS